MSPVALNVPWALDLRFDVNADGRTLKMLKVVDDFTRDCLPSLSSAPSMPIWSWPLSTAWPSSERVDNDSMRWPDHSKVRTRSERNP